MSDSTDEQIDWQATGLALLRDRGEHAVELAAAILHHALQELLREVKPKIILRQELPKSPRKLVLQAIAAFEVCGGLTQLVRRKLTDAERLRYNNALRTSAKAMLEAAGKKKPGSVQ